MQWLVDLIIEAIGIPPTYIDRGDPPGYDFTKPDLTLDGAYHDLDLSGIVPANAAAVHLSMTLVTPGAGTCFWLEAKYAVNGLNAFGFTTQIAGIELNGEGLVPIRSDGLVKYAGIGAAYTAIIIHVRGWWL